MMNREDLQGTGGNWDFAALLIRTGGLAAALLLAIPLCAQWVCATGGNCTLGTGNVGIGINSPIAALEVNGAVKANNHVAFLPWFNLASPPQGAGVPGYIKLVTNISQGESNMFSLKIKGYRYGIGGVPVEIRCGGYAYSGLNQLIQTGCMTQGTGDPVGIGVENGKVIVTIGSGASSWYYDHFTAEYSGWVAHYPSEFQWQFVYNTPPVTVNTHNVVIDDQGGTVSMMAPHSSLAVNGTITTKEVVVTNSGWADYVFAPGYAMAPLNEVASYIKSNHHLPGIPSAAEVAEKGVGLGEMQLKLLAKIEELTLLMIEADRKNVALEQRNEELVERMTRIEGLLKK